MLRRSSKRIQQHATDTISPAAQRIIDSRQGNGEQIEYLVIWKDMPVSQATWESVVPESIVRDWQAQQGPCVACASNESETWRPHYPLMQATGDVYMSCKQCWDFKEAANVSLDEDGLSNVCFVCYDGGNIIACDACQRVFCDRCMKRVLQEDWTEAANAAEWKCFVCVPKSKTEKAAVQGKSQTRKRAALGDISNAGRDANTQRPAKKPTTRLAVQKTAQSEVKEEVAVLAEVISSNVVINSEGKQATKGRTRSPSKRRSKGEPVQPKTEETSTIEGETEQPCPTGTTQPSSRPDFPSELVSIDDGDDDDIFAVKAYVDDISDYHFALERNTQFRVDAEYFSRQEDISPRMRTILIDWLVDVHHKFELRPETLHLTVQLIDRFLTFQNVHRTKLQLVGVTSMLLAAKYEEIYAPEIRDFVYISDDSFTKKEVIRMESLMLSKLSFSLFMPTAWTFIRRFLKAARVPRTDHQHNLALYFLERSLQEVNMLSYSASLMAASAVFLSLKWRRQDASVAENTDELWTPALQHHTRLQVGDLGECVGLMEGHAQRASTDTYKGVYEKYSRERFGGVARALDRVFKLQAEKK